MFRIADSFAFFFTASCLLPGMLKIPKYNWDSFSACTEDNKEFLASESCTWKDGRGNKERQFAYSGGCRIENGIMVLDIVCSSSDGRR